VVFDPLAADYDRTCAELQTGRWQREQVWRWLDRCFQPPGPILDIGCGTGIDALHLGQRGIAVYATDSSPAMVALTRLKGADFGVRAAVLAAEDLGQLTTQFRGAYANFAALNCVAELDPLAEALANCLLPGAPLVLVMFGRSCLWEMVGYSLRGKFNKAFRRFTARPVAVSIGAGLSATTYYHSAAYIKNCFRPDFELVAEVGIGIAVPPMYMEPWVVPRTGYFALAQALDLRLGGCWPYRSWGDHRLFVWRRRG
jgi:SAM-dependent methyltransferase